MPGQILRTCGTTGALSALLLAGGVAATAAPADRYGCIVSLCDTGDAACRGDVAMTLKRRSGTGMWDLTEPEGRRSTFSMLAPTGETAVALVSSDIDPDASAKGLMNIAEDGAMLLIIHGYFPDLSHVTYSGTCKAEAW